MAENLGTAVLKLQTDSSGLDKGLDRAEKRTRKIGQKFTSVGKKMSAAITLPIAGAAVAAGKAASDLEESMNAVNVVFGDSSGKIEAWGETAAETAGLAQAEFNQAATTIGSMLQNVGMSADQAAEKSINLTQRAADMASVFNTDVDQALGAIQAGIRGEIDPLERFGVSLNMASVKAHAVEEGMAAAGEELTAAQKTTARLSLIMEQTGKVAGDFADTSDQTANSLRVLKARATDVAAEMGEALLPMFNKIINVASNVVDWFSGLSDSQRNLLVAVSGIAAALGPLAMGIGAVTTAVSSLIPVMGTLVGILTGPAGLIMVATAAAGALALMTDRSKEVEQGVGGLNNAYSDVNASLEAAKEANKSITDEMSEQEKHAKRMMRVSQIHETLTGNRMEAQKQIADSIERQLKMTKERQNLNREAVNNVDQLKDRMTTLDKLQKSGVLSNQEWLNRKIQQHKTLLEQIQNKVIKRGDATEKEADLVQFLRSEIERYRKEQERITGETEKQSKNTEETAKNMNKAAENLPKISETMGAMPPLTIKRSGGEITGGQETEEGGGALSGIFSKLSGITAPIKNAVGDAFSFLKEIPGVQKIISMVSSLSNVVSLMNPFQTILEGVMDVLGPLINSLLEPLVGILKITGQLIGHLLAPALRLLEPIINFIAQIFIWLYNKVAVPVVNGIMKAFNKVYNGVVSFINWIINAINKIPGVSVGKVSRRASGAGTIDPIDMGDLEAAGGGGTEGETGGGGGSQIDQARPITVNIDIYDNELAGSDGFRELAQIIRGEFESMEGVNI